jgi:DNA-directed RNA polymerase I and III subunit RPAC2
MRDPSEAATETIKPSTSSSSTEATYSLQNEDHTLGNCLRYQLNKNPGVLVAGYSVPHPMERKVNVRVQTVAPVTADGAMREALLDVVSVCEHVTETFEEALKEGPKTTTAAKK